MPLPSQMHVVKQPVATSGVTIANAAPVLSLRMHQSMCSKFITLSTQLVASHAFTCVTCWRALQMLVSWVV